MFLARFYFFIGCFLLLINSYSRGVELRPDSSPVCKSILKVKLLNIGLEYEYRFQNENSMN